MGKPVSAGSNGREDRDLSAELRQAGEAVARLPRPAAPVDLAARTLARLEREAGVSAGLAATPATARRRRSVWRWWRLPITNPLARLAAAAVLVATLVFLSDADRAERVGQFFERVIGARAAEHVESVVDRMLLTLGPDFGQRQAQETSYVPAPQPPGADRQNPHGAVLPSRLMV